MRVEYDQAADAAYFAFSDADPARQVKIDDARVIDFAADGSLVGVEILSPSRGVDLDGLPRLREIARASRALGFRVVSSGRAGRPAESRSRRQSDDRSAGSGR